MSAKKDRQNAIRTLVRENQIENQDQLLKLLVEKGFALTQATLSRDMRDLKIVKNPTGSSYAYQLSREHVLHNSQDTGVQLSAIGFVSLDFSGNLAVLRTRPGYAMGMAAEIDKKATETILGTVAGDDTVLLIPRDGFTRDEIKIALAQFIIGIEI